MITWVSVACHGWSERVFSVLLLLSARMKEAFQWKIIKMASPTKNPTSSIYIFPPESIFLFSSQIVACVQVLIQDTRPDARRPRAHNWEIWLWPRERGHRHGDGATHEPGTQITLSVWLITLRGLTEILIRINVDIKNIKQRSQMLHTCLSVMLELDQLAGLFSKIV